jgi:tetratricopeptide (TPR) repeat protein
MFGWIDRVSYTHPYNTIQLLFACQWLAEQGAPRAIEAARACLRRLERANELIASPETDAALSEGRGSMALAEGDHAQAVDYFQHALTRWQELDRPYDHIRALSSLGQALMRSGETQEAHAVFDQALDIVEILATELEDAELQSSFFDSQLVQEIREGHTASERSEDTASPATPPALT